VKGRGDLVAVIPIQRGRDDGDGGEGILNSVMKVSALTRAAVQFFAYLKIYGVA